MRKHYIKKVPIEKPTVKLYKLENGIKIPAPTQSSGSTPTRVSATLSAMEIGQSFAIVDELHALKAGKVVSDANGREKAKQGGRKYTTRRVKKGIRIWRVK